MPSFCLASVTLPRREKKKQKMFEYAEKKAHLCMKLFSKSHESVRFN